MQSSKDLENRDEGTEKRRGEAGEVNEKKVREGKEIRLRRGASKDHNKKLGV